MALTRYYTHLWSGFAYLLLFVFAVCGSDFPWKGRAEWMYTEGVISGEITQPEWALWAFTLCRFYDELKQMRNHQRVGELKSYFSKGGNWLGLTHLAVLISLALIRNRIGG